VEVTDRPELFERRRPRMCVVGDGRHVALAYPDRSGHKRSVSAARRSAVAPVRQTFDIGGVER
jgi:hypothetical protein